MRNCWNFKQFPLFLSSAMWYNETMKKKSLLTEEQLNLIPKDVLVTMHLQLVDTMKQIVSQNNQLLRQVTALEEKVNILTQRQFGRKNG